MKKKSLSLTLINSAKALGFPKATVDQLEELGIPEVQEMNPKMIRNLRIKINVSQGVFAAILNVSPSTVHKWEQGAAKPQNSALRLLSILGSRGVGVLGKGL